MSASMTTEVYLYSL